MLKFRVITKPIDPAMLGGACRKAELVVASQAMKDTEPYVPALTRALTLMTHIETLDGHATIIYPGPYARFLWGGKVMIDPNTGSTWAPLHGHKVLTNRDLIFNTSVHPLAQAYWFNASQAQNADKWARVAEKAVKNGL